VNAFTSTGVCATDKVHAMLQHPTVRAPIDRAQILKAAASIGVLGAGTHLGPRLMALLCKPTITAREIAALLANEPAVYARVLRVANSPYYGQARAITSIERALLVLGLDAVRGIAAAACLDRTMARDSAGTPVDMRALVQHSLATAAAAEALARIAAPPLAAEAFIAGLLHNLGIAVQVHLDTPGVRAMIQVRAIDAYCDMRTLESERVVVGHEECAGVIFEAWQLPAALVAAVRYHHTPMAAPEAHRPLTALVNLGATLGLSCGNTFALEPAPGGREAGAQQLLALRDEDLDRVEAELPERIAGLRSALLDP
jgi:HD-like signal output (HDOD) protein